jgi:hypothetical protein
MVLLVQSQQSEIHVDAAQQLSLLLIEYLKLVAEWGTLIFPAF